MSINVQKVFDSKQSQFNALGSVSRFGIDFLEAINAAVDEYNSLLENTATAHLLNLDSTLALSQNHTWIIGYGIDKHILRMGNFKSGDLTLEQAELKFEKALASAIHDRDVAAAAAADTPGDVIGYMGD